MTVRVKRNSWYYENESITFTYTRINHEICFMFNNDSSKKQYLNKRQTTILYAKHFLLLLSWQRATSNGGDVDITMLNAAMYSVTYGFIKYIEMMIFMGFVFVPTTYPRPKITTWKPRTFLVSRLLTNPFRVTPESNQIGYAKTFYM